MNKIEELTAAIAELPPEFDYIKGGMNIMLINGDLRSAWLYFRGVKDAALALGGDTNGIGKVWELLR